MQETAQLVLMRYRAENQKASELKETLKLPLKRLNQATSANTCEATIEIDVEAVQSIVRLTKNLLSVELGSAQEKKLQANLGK